MTAQSLPSLACPLIASPANGVGKEEKSLFLPPFSEIDLNKWDGFTFSHLHWVGHNLKKINLEDPQCDEEIHVRHEFSHKQLAILPFPQLKKYEIFRFYDLILTTFEKGQQIRVPLISNKSGNKLRKQWERIVRLKRASELVEEVYAVRSSLLKARERGLISHGLLKEKTELYKEGYEEFIPEYAKTYEAFDFIASQIGETAAKGMIYHALLTCDPDVAFTHIMYEMHKIDSRDRDLLWNLSREPKEGAITEALVFFSDLTDRLDRDDSRFRRRIMQDLDDVAEIIKRDCSVLSKYLKNDFIKFLFHAPDSFLISKYIAGYSCLRFSFSKVRENNNYELQDLIYKGYRPFILFLEAIRQQLTRGIGLLCPFWLYSAPRCCSSRNRALIEKVWSCTYHNSACALWKRMGCLQDRRRGTLSGNP